VRLPISVPAPSFISFDRAETGYTTPTPIQAQAIPLVLKGGDLLAAAQTGTGKTAGFTLPILHRLTENPLTPSGRPRCLILTPRVNSPPRSRNPCAPTASTCPEIHGHVRRRQHQSPDRRPARRVDILVATPGRLLDHVGQKTVDLSGVEILVLDEADRMLDMGFIRDIKKVIALLPKQRQNLLFSATFSDEIKLLANGLLHNPGCIEVARRNTPTELVEQSVHLVPQDHKRDLLAHLIRTQLAAGAGVHPHQARRQQAGRKLRRTASRRRHPRQQEPGGAHPRPGRLQGSKLQVLVATDIAARGIDIDQLPHVVNFELPNVPEDYVHRIGRTGRAGSVGSRRVPGGCGGDGLPEGHRAPDQAHQDAPSGAFFHLWCRLDFWPLIGDPCECDHYRSPAAWPHA
jgi:ATP-dependent RNA helicase RhlE